LSNNINNTIDKVSNQNEIIIEAKEATKEIGNQFDSFIELFNWDIISFYKDEIFLFIIAFSFLFIIKNIISNKILSHLEHTKNTINEVKSLTIYSFYLLNFLFGHIILYFQGFAFEAFKFVGWIFFFAYFIFGIIILNNINKLFFRFLYKSNKYKIQKVEAHFLSKIISFFIFFFGFLFALSMIGINISLLLGSLGFVGVALSFAAKESIANLFGGITILLNKSFDHGDWIYISSEEEGTVVETHFLTTTIRTFDNALISIPNSKLGTNSIRNWSKRNVGRRIKFDIGILYDTKVEDIKNIVSDIKEYLFNNPDIAKPTSNEIQSLIQKKDVHGVKETLLVNTTSFGESSINITIYCFSKTVNWSEWLEVREKVMYEIINIVRKNNSDFAFPTTTLDFDESSIIKK